MIMRPAFNYFGGKFRIAPEIRKHFPHHHTYVEPFAGAASVFINKPRAKVEVLNDLSEDIVNYFRILRAREDELIRAISLTPYSRSEYKLSQQPVNDGNDLERARRFYVRMSQGRAHGDGSTGRQWQFQRTANRSGTAAMQFTRINHLHEIANRLKGVFIESRPALKVIEMYDTPETLFYIDPPYVHDTRYKKNNYQYEMTNDDHRQLAEALAGVRGMVIISGYPSPLYDELYTSWRCVRFDALDTNHNERTECIWLSDNVPASIQLTMFN